MTLTAHDEYRNSRIGWIDIVPVGWGESRLGRLARIYAGGTPDRENAAYWEGGHIPWVNSGAVNQWEIVKPSALITNAALSGSSTRWVREGALVLALAGQGKTKGMAAQMSIAATCNQSMAAIDTDSRLDEKFLLWWLTANYSNVRSMGGGDLRDGLNLVHVASIPVPLPPLDEQRQIAEYLDRETGKIDELIAKQELLIATLAERGRALVAQGVTRGIQPEVQLAKSNDWFGSYPAHWTVGRVGNAFTLTLGKMLNASAKNEGTIRPYLRAGNIQEDGVDLSEVKLMAFSADEAATLSLRAGDVVVVEGGGGYGRSDYLDHDIEGWAFQNHVIRARPRAGHDGRFFDYFVKTVRASGHFESLGSFATIPNVSADKLSRIRFAMPPLDEQRAISASIDSALAAISHLSTKVIETLALLRERRSALISAAATGKIDVRGL